MNPPNRTILYGILAAVLLVALGTAVYFLRPTSARRKADAYKGEITQYIAATDADGDGKDDQTDILESALAYIATQPKYKSAYYAGGYPDDGNGVCTDVVANGLKGAGYDLMQLVAEDVAAHPEQYDADAGDANIDFRRVRNLKVFFKNHATALTTDLDDIEAWQGGDIVIFEDHIGIVSDHRNRRGVPFVIHHYSNWQRSYEEDVLEDRDDLVAHYRMP